jgi:hypothetical protein
MVMNPAGLGSKDDCAGEGRQQFIRWTLQANVGLISLSGHNRFLPNPSQFTINQLSYHSTLCSSDTDRRKINQVRKLEVNQNLFFSHGGICWPWISGLREPFMYVRKLELKVHISCFFRI